ncbi:MAG TPA: hypothetical protein PKL59_22035, partial [Nitrospira sp.]|nr:hypothetical protein [Nitrospira sp.]HNM20626.1 hypothetical protein [Nitrospira sp.]
RLDRAQPRSEPFVGRALAWRRGQGHPENMYLSLSLWEVRPGMRKRAKRVAASFGGRQCLFCGLIGG